MSNLFFENVNLLNEITYLSVQHDGQFVLREPLKEEVLINRFLVPFNEKKRKKMERRVLQLIWKGKAKLHSEYIVTRFNQNIICRY